MSLTLELVNQPDVPIEAETLRPDALAGLSEGEIAALPILHGNQSVSVGDFFRVSGNGNGDLRLSGDLGKIKLIGGGMAEGRLYIEGNGGMHLGAEMRGGEIMVDGNVTDWLGAEMSGGRITVKGDAGHLVGGGYRGSQIGMRGGEIIVHGRAGNEVGNTMRNGLIAIGGACGDFAGVNMLAGTIIVFGAAGWRYGAGMKRGTIVCMQPVELLPTFAYACTYEPTFLRLYMNHLRRLGLTIDDAWIDGAYARWSGDAVELNRGEVLVYAGNK